MRFRRHGHRFPLVLHHHFQVAVGGFHWASFFTAAGAIATAAGVLGGAVVAFVYGRKADVHVEGEVHKVIVAAGETLSTTVSVELGPPPPEGVIGWRVAFQGVAKRALWIGGWEWDDRAFVPVPA